MTAAIIMFCCLSTTFAQDPGQPSSTQSPTGLKKTLDWVIDRFQKPLHPTLASIAPGAGITAGIGYTPKAYDGGKLRYSLRASGSTRQYWVFEADGLYLNGNRYGIDVYARARRMTQLPFFGIGPNTLSTDETDFRLLERTAGGLAWVRPQPWYALGSRVEGLWPEIGRGRNEDVPSIETKSSEATAPGLATQPSFGRYQVFLDVNYPRSTAGLVKARNGGDIEVSYNFFHDTDTGHYSFRRFDAEAQHRFTIAGPDRNVTLRAMMSAADVPTGHAVPFYLQQTLGGDTNLLGFRDRPIGSSGTLATLRGFRNFRFRDQDFALVQAEIQQKVFSLLDVGFFVDAGNVGHELGQLKPAEFRHDFGVSLNIKMNNKALVRFDFGFGGGEGTHGFVTPGSGVAP